jgi:hypothetical protein
MVSGDGTVIVSRLSVNVELHHRVGDLISDDGDEQWRVEEIELEERYLVVSEVMLEVRRMDVPLLLAA